MGLVGVLVGVCTGIWIRVLLVLSRGLGRDVGVVTLGGGTGVAAHAIDAGAVFWRARGLGQHHAHHHRLSRRLCDAASHWWTREVVATAHHLGAFEEEQELCN